MNTDWIDNFMPKRSVPVLGVEADVCRSDASSSQHAYTFKSVESPDCLHLIEELFR